MNSYEALGLAHTLNPVAQGGAEGPVSSTRAESTLASKDPTSPKPIPQRYGRIIRDENGAVLRIELPEEADETQANSSRSRAKGKGRAVETWGDVMDDSDEETEKMVPSEASNWLHIGNGAPKQEPKQTGLGISQKRNGKELVMGTLLYPTYMLSLTH